MLDTILMDSAATSATRPRYNERLRGVVPDGADALSVLFTADRGAECAQGRRVVDLVRGADGAWHVLEETWSPTRGLVTTSRKGYGADDYQAPTLRQYGSISIEMILC